MWFKEIEEDWCYSWIRKLDIVKITVPPKPFYIFSAFPNKISVSFFLEIETADPQIHIEF